MLQFSFSNGLYIEGNEEPIAEFDIWISKKIEKILISEDGKVIDRKIEYEIKAKTNAGKELQCRRIDSIRKLDDFSLWDEIVDAVMTQNERKLLEARLQQSIASAIEEKRYVIERPGIYTLNDEKVYVVGTRVIKSEKNKCIIELAENIKGYVWKTFKKNTIYSDGFEQNYIQAEADTSIVLFFATLLGAIKPFFTAAGYNPVVCIMLYGKSGVGKTRLVKSICCLTNDKSMLWGSMLNDTKRDVLSSMANAFGFVYVLDDFHPTVEKYTYNRQISLINAVLRRMEQVGKSPVVVMTAEQLDGEYSAQDRMLQLHVKNVNSTAINNIESGTSYMAKLAYDFVSVLMESYDDVIQDIDVAYSSLDETANRTRAERQGEELKIVAQLYGKYMGKDYTIQLKKALENQMQTQKKHMDRIKMLDHEQDYILLFQKIIDGKGIYDICTQENESKYRVKYNQYYMKREIIYITKTALEYGIKKYLQGNEKSICKKMIDSLREHGILLEDKDTTTKKFHNVRHLCISQIALENYTEFKNTHV